MSVQKNSERINELARKWLSGTITPEEKMEFDSWYEEAGRAHAASGAGDHAASGPAADALRDRMFSAIAAREGLGEDRPLIHGPQHATGAAAVEGKPAAVEDKPAAVEGKTAASAKRPMLRRMLAVAAVVTVVIVPVWLFRHRFQRTVPMYAARDIRGHDLPPGGNKATLTLSNGQTVALDPGGRRSISDSSGATIRQLDSGLLYSPPAPEDQTSALSYNTLTVPRGGQYRIVLSDGTTVWLNSASSLRYPTAFRGDYRVVTLTGEGYFEVAKDEGHPFRVIAAGELIDVLGTQFNVNCYADEADTRTTLLQGSVRVSLPDRSDPLVIRPGQQAVVVNPGQAQADRSAGRTVGGNLLHIVEGADLEQVVAWKNGYFQLNDADIHAIMRQAARWYDVEVVYQGSAPAQRLSGKLRRSASVAEFLDMLSYFNIHFQVQGRKITVMAGGGATTIHS